MPRKRTCTIIPPNPWFRVRINTVLLLSKCRVADVLNGCSASIIAYGQTGAGKTYTMQVCHRDKRQDEH